jgi:hypothetical protein
MPQDARIGKEGLSPAIGMEIRTANAHTTNSKLYFVSSRWRRGWDIYQFQLSRSAQYNRIHEKTFARLLIVHDARYNKYENLSIANFVINHAYDKPG